MERFMQRATQIIITLWVIATFGPVLLSPVGYYVALNYFPVSRVGEANEIAAIEVAKNMCGFSFYMFGVTFLTGIAVAILYNLWRPYPDESEKK